MKRKIISKLNTIMVILIIIVCNIIIANNFIKALQYKSYLKLDNNNSEYIENMVSYYYKPVNKNIEKVAYMQGLGDWYLFLYYEDGTEENVILGNHSGKELRDYIVENGYNEGIVSWKKIIASFVVVGITIIYEIIYLIVQFISKKNNKSEIKKIDDN